MTEVDRSRLEEKLAFIAAQVADLRRLAAERDLGSFAADPWIVRGAKYALQTAIEAMIDTAYHLSAKAFRYAPDDGRDAVDRLVKEGVLPADSAGIFQEMIRFRNRIVHGYDRVEDARVYELLTGRLGDFEVWIAAIRAWLSRTSAPADGEGRPGGPA